MLLSLRKIAISNFRGVRERLVLDLADTPSGLYFVRGTNRKDSRLGSNGAGKSTLFAEAFIWALTGRTSRSQRPGSDVENRANSGKLTSVEVEIALDGNIHTISRSRNPNALTHNGTKIEQQDLLNTLPLSEDAIRKSVLIDQFGGMFLNLRPEDKSRLFTETLDLDRWIRRSERAAERALLEQRKADESSKRLTGVQHALAEARDQLEAAVRGETKFEDDRESRLKTAIDTERVSLRAVDVARNTYIDTSSALERAGGQENAPELQKRREQQRRLQRAVAESEATATSTTREVNQLKAELAKYREGLETCPECGQRVNSDHVKRKRGEIADRLEHIRKLAKEYISAAAATAAELEKENNRVVKLEGSLAEVFKLKADKDVAGANLAGAERDAKRASAEVKRLNAEENPFTAQCDRLEERVKQLRAQVKGLKAAAEEAEDQVAVNQFWQKGFREIRLNLLDDALAELELTTNRHAEALGLEGWRIEFATERETKRGSISHGFTVFLYPPGSTEPINWDTYCGGEVQRWQLAATFGLAEVLLSRAGVSTDFEVLDEPTTHLSPEGIEDLLACLSDRARELNRRIFLIDHNSLDRGAFDGVVSVVHDANRGTIIEDDGGVLVATSPKRRERVMV